MDLRILTTLLLAAAALPAQTANICDRTPQVRDAILEAVGADDCTAVAIAAVESLPIGSSGLTSLKAGDFDGLTGLRSLYLHNNQLTALPAGVFDELTRLRQLYLEENQLTVKGLPAGVFDELTVLRLLDLQHNQLTSLPAGAFDGLGNLRGLELGGNALTTLPAGAFDGLTSLEGLYLQNNQLTSLPAGAFDGLGNLRGLYLGVNALTTLPAGVFDGLTSLEALTLSDNPLTTLPAGAFDGLGNLRGLYLGGSSASRSASRHALTTLPAGVFDGLTSLETLTLNHGQLTTLPAGVFDGLTSLETLYLNHGQLTTLPAVFDGLTGLRSLYLHNNQLTTLPAGVFDDLGSLESLDLFSNALTALPAGAFDGLGNLRWLYLHRNQLTVKGLPAGVFDDLGSLESLNLSANHLVGLTRDDPLFARLRSGAAVYLDFQTDPPRTDPPRTVDVCDRTPQVRDAILEAVGADDCAAVDADAMADVESLRIEGLTSLRAGDFDGLDNLRTLDLSGNALTTLPAGVFDGLTSLETLDLSDNHLVGLTPSDPVFAGLSAAVRIGRQTNADGTPRLAAAVPLMLSAAHPSRQGFARIVNESDESGSVRVFAFDDGGHAPEPIDIRLGAGQVVHFNSNDLEDGNPNKGIERGVGAPVQGDWRLDVETALPVRVLAFVRTSDGFLTAMHDVLPRNAAGRLVAQTFNPGSNIEQESKLRLVNTGEDAADVSIEGVDDQGNAAGPVTLTLAGGESRTLSAFDLENGAGGLAGTLGDGAGKWRLFIDAGSAVVGASLLDAVTGHLTNISTMGAALDGE